MVRPNIAAFDANHRQTIRFGPIVESAAPEITNEFVLPVWFGIRCSAERDEPGID